MAHTAGWPAKKSSAFIVQFPIFDADGDLVTGAADLDTEVSKDGGNFIDATNEAAEIAAASGCYAIELTATEMGADRVMTITKTSTAGAKTAPNMIYPSTANIDDVKTDSAAILADTGTDGVLIGAGAIGAAAFAANAIAAAAIADGAIDAATFAAGAVNAAAIADDAITAAKIADGAIDAATFAAGAINAAAIANAAIDAATFAAGAIDAAAIANAAIDAATFAADAIDAAALAADAGAEIADAVWDEAAAGHVGAGTFGDYVGDLWLSGVSAVSAVNDAGATTTDFDTSLAEASNDHYNGHWLIFTSGNLIGQARMIRDYDGAAKNVSFDRAFTEAPGNADTFTILGAPSSAWDTLLARLSDVEGEAAVTNRMALWAISKLANKVNAAASPATIYKTDDATPLFTQTLTLDAGADPITVLDTV